MFRGHTLTKTIRQWGLIVWTGVGGFAVGIAGFAFFGLDGILSALNALPAVVAGIILSGLLALATLAIGALFALSRRTLAQSDVEDRAQQHDARPVHVRQRRRVSCSATCAYIEMHHLRREQLRGGMPLREMLVLRSRRRARSPAIRTATPKVASGRPPKAAPERKRSGSTTGALSRWPSGRCGAAAG